MKLGDIAALAGMHGSELSDGELDIQIDGLSADSRKIQSGFVFFALSGDKANGSQFVASAIENGACAIVSFEAIDEPNDNVPNLIVENPRLVLAKAAAAFYQNQPQTIVAVTGTAGKTSVASFVRQIWDKIGQRAAMIGTTGIVAPGRKEYGALTTPDPVTLHSLMSELTNDGVTHCSMEASSHGLDQYRLDGINLAAGAFTNLGRDHMDYHPTVEHYFNAKMALFNRVLPKGSPAVIFADDEWSVKAVQCASDAGQKVLTVGHKGSFLTLKRVEQYRHEQRAEIHHEGQIFEVNLPLAGDFQMSNALVAAGLCIATGADAKLVLQALETIEGAPGRLDLVGKTQKGAPVYVDYAHKPDALEHVLKAVRPFTTGRIVLAFGCGGDRDKGKRKLMGEIAAKLANVVIVTDDNPRSEAPDAIRQEILLSVPDAIDIGDRQKAIETSIEMLEEGDSLIIAGKGHEHGQIVGDKTLPFSDHEVARSVLGLEA
ncbi:MAG: UDP-N-acetylmuramoyl-L-alanyl-D-glutamate--2,6-diaminopimelate ligase [Lentilitoribacter sp.]